MFYVIKCTREKFEEARNMDMEYGLHAFAGIVQNDMYVPAGDLTGIFSGLHSSIKEKERFFNQETMEVLWGYYRNLVSYVCHTTMTTTDEELYMLLNMYNPEGLTWEEFYMKVMEARGFIRNGGVM